RLQYNACLMLAWRALGNAPVQRKRFSLAGDYGRPVVRSATRVGQGLAARRNRIRWSTHFEVQGSTKWPRAHGRAVAALRPRKHARRKLNLPGTGGFV